MAIAWKTLLVKNNFPDFVGSLVNKAFNPGSPEREMLAGFEQGAQKGRVEKIKHSIRLKTQNRPGQKTVIGGATLGGAAAGAGLGMLLGGPLGAFAGGVVGGAAANFAQIPVNQVAANQFANDYDKLKDTWKSMNRHLPAYSEHMQKCQAAIMQKDPDGAGHHLYKAAQHMAKVKTGFQEIETSVDAFKKLVPDDDIIKKQLLIALAKIDTL